MSEAKVVGETSAIVQFAKDAMKEAAAKGRAAAPHGPMESWMWQLIGDPWFRLQGYKEVTFSACAWHGNQNSAGRIEPNCEEFEGIEEKCEYIHDDESNDTP